MREWGALLISVALLILAAEVVWRYLYGVELIPGDHETGTIEQSFLKHRRTWRYEFRNPAFAHHDVTPLEKLSPLEKDQLIEFCEIRYGIDGPEMCYVEFCKEEARAGAGCDPYSRP